MENKTIEWDSKPSGWDLKFFDSGEWQWIQEQLDDMDKKGQAYCPSRENLFRSLDDTPFETVRCAIIGQDPYPDARHATGVAFSVPKTIVKLPQTLVNIFREYKNDLHYDKPTRGSLAKWSARGVLLWNAIPSCTAGLSLSHDWEEWSWLTKEIVEKLSNKGIVFAFLGGVARRFVQYVNPDTNGIIEVSHPSPRGVNAKPGRTSAWSTFNGCRLFTTINAKLIEEGLETIDWKL